MCVRVLKHQFRGMQQHRIHVKMFQPKFVLFITTMRTVADNRVKNMCKMAPQLMHPSRFRSCFHQ